MLGLSLTGIGTASAATSSAPAGGHAVASSNSDGGSGGGDGGGGTWDQTKIPLPHQPGQPPVFVLNSSKVADVEALDQTSEEAADASMFAFYRTTRIAPPPSPPCPTCRTRSPARTARRQRRTRSPAANGYTCSAWSTRGPARQIAPSRCARPSPGARTSRPMSHSGRKAETQRRQPGRAAANADFLGGESCLEDCW